VLRRVLRRAVVHGRDLGLESFLPRLADVVVEQMGAVYPELVEQRGGIARVLAAEEAIAAAGLELRRNEGIVAGRGGGGGSGLGGGGRGHRKNRQGRRTPRRPAVRRHQSLRLHGKRVAPARRAPQKPLGVHPRRLA